MNQSPREEEPDIPDFEGPAEYLPEYDPAEAED